MAESDDDGLVQSVVYFRENDGQGALKAYYTSDVRLEPGPGVQRMPASG